MSTTNISGSFPENASGQLSDRTSRRLRCVSAAARILILNACHFKQAELPSGVQRKARGI